MIPPSAALPDARTRRSTSPRAPSSSCDAGSRGRAGPRRGAPASAPSASAAPTRTWWSRSRREPAAPRPARAQQLLRPVGAHARPPSTRATARLRDHLDRATRRRPRRRGVHAAGRPAGLRPPPRRRRRTASAEAVARLEPRRHGEPRGVTRKAERRAARSPSCSPARARSTWAWARGSTATSRLPRGRRPLRRGAPARARLATCARRLSRRGRSAADALEADRAHAAGAVRRRVRAGAAVDVLGRRPGGHDRPQRRRVRRPRRWPA